MAQQPPTCGRKRGGRGDYMRVRPGFHTDSYPPKPRLEVRRARPAESVRSFCESQFC
jgi:hypothetical protein